MLFKIPMGTYRQFEHAPFKKARHPCPTTCHETSALDGGVDD